MQIPSLLAFDFDGVLCDGLQEYFQVAWRTYTQLPLAQLPITLDSALESGLESCLDPLRPHADLFPDFAQGRAVIETGWEMPLLIHALRRGDPLDQIFAHWGEMLQEFLAQPGMPDAKTLGKILDGIRDEWIAGDLSGWLALHRFYPGVIDGLGQLLAAGHTVAIISTKEGRFIQELLHQAGVNLPSHLIFGKEVQRPKEDTLYPLVQQYPRAAVYFIEDRLAALERIKAHPHLGQVHLYLATWGYNTAADRNRAQGDARIQCLESFSCVTALLPTDN